MNSLGKVSQVSRNHTEREKRDHWEWPRLWVTNDQAGHWLWAMGDVEDTHVVQSVRRRRMADGRHKERIPGCWVGPGSVGRNSPLPHLGAGGRRRQSWEVSDADGEIATRRGCPCWCRSREVTSGSGWCLKVAIWFLCASVSSLWGLENCSSLLSCLLDHSRMEMWRSTCSVARCRTRSRDWCHT